jgi:hypothetical protein
LSFDNTSSTFAFPGSDPNNLFVNLTNLNNFLTTHGSNITFASLGAQSNVTGGSPSTLGEEGTAMLSGTTTGNATAITVATTESGFMGPSGTGTLTSQPVASFHNVAFGSLTTSSSYNGTSTPPYTSTSTGPAINPGAPASAPTSIGIGPIVPGFSLDNSAIIDMTGSTPSAGTTTTFADSATVAGATTATPEPASLTLLGFGAVGLLGYGWRLHRRGWPAAAP